MKHNSYYGKTGIYLSLDQILQVEKEKHCSIPLIINPLVGYQWSFFMLHFKEHNIVS
jgi:hypothetical protein